MSGCPENLQNGFPKELPNHIPQQKLSAGNRTTHLTMTRNKLGFLKSHIRISKVQQLGKKQSFGVSIIVQRLSYFNYGKGFICINKALKP